MIITQESILLSKVPPRMSTPPEAEQNILQGHLVLDSFYNVIAVDRVFSDFLKQFGSGEVHFGQNLRHSINENFPVVFIEAVESVMMRNVPQANVQLEGSLESSSSFRISIQTLKPPIDCNGVRITVEVESPSCCEKRKQQNEGFFSTLVEKGTSIYQLTDSSLSFIFSSENIEPILGFLPAELLGKKVIDFVHPDDKDNVRNWLKNVQNNPGKLSVFEYRLKSKRGEYIWVENSATNLLDNYDLKAIVMNLRDIQAKKIADDALIQAEQRLSLLLNNTAESFIILNSRLRIVTYNKAAQECSPFFYNKELQSGFSVLDLIDESSIQDYITLFEQVFSGQELEKETRFIDEDGKPHIFSHTYRPLINIQNNDIFGVFITSREITERNQLAEQLTKNSERLKTAQEIARMGYFEYDSTQKSFFCSDQFYEILEIENSIQSWRDISSLEKYVHVDDREHLKVEMGNAMKYGNDFNIEFRYHTNSGKEKVILAIGGAKKSKLDNTIIFRITLQDITDSKMAMLALQTLESRFKTIFDNSIDGLILSTHDGHILSANPSACKMLGYDQDEMSSLVRVNLLDIESEDVKKMVELQNTVGEYVGELKFRHKKGYYVPVEISSISMKDPNGHSYVSTIVRDITEKKKIEEEQKSLTEELLKNNQDLQQFSFITSHNLRAPVANLLSLLSLYNFNEPADEFNQVLVEKFGLATQQLNQTLNDLVNVLVIKSNNNIEREAISFTQIFTEVRKNVDNLLSECKGKILADFTAIDQVFYNRIHIESIFLNMITNAIRYKSPDRSLLINISSRKQDGWVIVSFADNGSGMDLKRYGDRLFGLYQRFHGNKEGKGLGLYMTKSQITAMGGKIEVESEPNVGTTFNIYFKRQED